MTAIRRLDESELSALLGNAVVSRMTNRNRGGKNGYKGSRYENLFGAHRAARLISKWIDTGEDALLEWQSDEIVDDLVVRRDSQLSFKAYQLKNSPRVSWTGGDPSIEDDFKDQQRIAVASGYTDIRVRLVCSDSQTASGLSKAVPPSIAGCARALHFPYDTSAHRLLDGSDWLKKDFAAVSRYAAATAVEASYVAVVLAGALAELYPKAWISEIYSQARTMRPELLRSTRTEADALAQLDPQFRDLLNNLPGFNYSVVRGFLHWTASNGAMKGVLSIDCFNPKFNSFQSNIIKQNPKVFEDIEGVLL